jgi:lipid A 3-O-deacylase
MPFWRKLKYLFTAFLISFIPSIAHAEQGVSIASGYGTSSTIPLRIGIQQGFNHAWCKKSHFHITGYFEASVYSLHSKRRPRPDFISIHGSSNRNMNAAALAGVMRIESKEALLGKMLPYLDIGFGLGYVSKKEMGGRKLGIHFQFEDRLGVGFRFGEKRQYDLCYRAVHISNAYLGQQNDGFNLHLIVLGYWFS